MVVPIYGTSVKFPCMDCPDRHQSCWAECERYKKAKEKQEEQNCQRDKQRHLEEDFFGVRKKYVRKQKKWGFEPNGEA